MTTVGHAVAVGCDACSCGDVVGLATGPPPLPAPPPTEQKSPFAVGLEDMQLRSGATLAVACLESDMQLARPLFRRPLRQKKV